MVFAHVDTCGYMYGVDTCELGDMGKSYVVCAHGSFTCQCVCANACATGPAAGRREDSVIWLRPHIHKPQKCIKK